LIFEVKKRKKGGNKMAAQKQIYPGHLERRLTTGTPHGEKRSLIPGEIREYIPKNGGAGPGQSFPASFSGFGVVDPIQGAIDLFKSSLWARLLIIGVSVFALYYGYKKEK
jgi:hypothetical protein